MTGPARRTTQTFAMRLLMAAALASAAPAVRAGSPDVVEHLTMDLNGDGRPDQLTLMKPDRDAPGEFSMIEIDLAGGGEPAQFHDENGWQRFGADPANRALARRTLLGASRLCLVQGGKGERLLIAQGVPYASGPGTLDVYRLSATVTRVFSDRVQLERLDDVDGDGRLDLVAGRTPREMPGDCEEYAPRRVFSLADRFEPNAPLEEKLNRQTDGFYAAPASDFFVHTDGGGRRKLRPISQASRCR